MAAIHLPIVPPPLPHNWSAPPDSGKSISRESVSVLFPWFSGLRGFGSDRFSRIKALVERRLFPVGPAYLAHVRRKVHDLTFEAHDKHEEERNRLAGGSPSDEIIDDLGVGDEEEDEDLLSLDPKEWKVHPSQTSRGVFALLTSFVKQKQDHYAVLGLSHLRFTATNEQIKIARALLAFTIRQSFRPLIASH